MQTPVLHKLCNTYIASSDKTLNLGYKLDNTLEHVSKKDAKSYLKALRKENTHYLKILRKINQIILTTPDDKIALKLFNLQSYKANEVSIKAIQQRNLHLDKATRLKIKNTYTHLNALKATRTKQSTNAKKDSFDTVFDKPYPKINKYDDADGVKLNPSSYLNKHITLRCNADSLYVKKSKKIHHYTMLNGFKCENFTNEYKTSSYLWNVYTHQSNLKLFEKISKKTLTFTAYARLKPRNNFEQEYILLIDKAVQNYD